MSNYSALVVLLDMVQGAGEVILVPREEKCFLLVAVRVSICNGIFGF